MDDIHDNPVPIEINGVLDLHHFLPRETKFLVPDYLEECVAKGIYEVRIIHGKGTGALRRTVHSILDRLDSVIDYHLADETRGAWGATIVSLRK